MGATDGRGHAEAVLGARVRAVRRERGVSLRALAGAVGVSPATLSQIENGRTGLGAVRLHRLADALGVAAADVLGALDDLGAPDDPDGPDGRRPSPGPPTAAGGPAGRRGAVPPGDGAAAGQHVDDWRAYGPLDFDPVLRAALEEFLETGYHGATVRGIAARSGLSVPGIYHYYAGKQQMLVTLLERTVGELLARARAARGEGRDPVERFGLLVEHLALFHTHRRELGFVGASEMRSLGDRDRRAIAGMRTAQQRMVDEEVEAAVRAGRFRTAHPREAARAVVTMCTALASWWRPGGPLGPERIAERYVRFALDLMRAR